MFAGSHGEHDRFSRRFFPASGRQARDDRPPPAGSGGEMVPHIKVEDLLQELAGATEQTFVVTAVPDEQKGERLVVLHTLHDDRLEQCLEKLGKSDLPALWRPRADQFLRIEKLPYLGTGKLDLRTARELALEMTKRAIP